MSLWDEIWAYLDKYYFSATAGDQYVYLKFDGKTGMTVFSIIVGLCVGMAVASFVMLYQRNHVGRFVRRLFKKNAHTADTAVTRPTVARATPSVFFMASRLGASSPSTRLK